MQINIYGGYEDQKRTFGQPKPCDCHICPVCKKGVPSWHTHRQDFIMNKEYSSKEREQL